MISPPEGSVVIAVAIRRWTGVCKSDQRKSPTHQSRRPI